MATDFSPQMYERYSKYDDDRVRVKFIDGHVEAGILAGHYFGDPGRHESFIHEWDFVPCDADEHSEFAIHQKSHKKICQKDIVGVYFYCDKTVIGAG